MEADVLPDKGPRQQLRLMARLSPHKDLVRLFKTPAEAWEHLDDLYANPVVVAEKVIRAFTNLDSLEGSTDEAKVISLQKKLQSLYLTLEVVNEQEQLTRHKPLINDAIRLLPRLYRIQFTKEMMEKQETLTPSGRELTAEEKYNYLSTWLKKNAKNFTIYVNSMENPTTSGSKEKQKEERKPGKSRVNALSTQKRKDESNSTGSTDSKKSSKGSTRYGDDCLNKIPAKEMEKIKKQWSQWGQCPACKAEGHVFEGDQGWNASASYSDCKKFMTEWDVDTKADFIVKQKACVRCLSRSHTGKECRKPEERWYCRVKENGQLCKGKHSNHLHGTKTKLWNAIVSVTNSHHVSDDSNSDSSDHEELKQEALLPVASIKVKKGCWATTLFDTGATCSLIRNGFAQRCGLKAKKVTQMVTVCGEAPKLMELNCYKIVIKTDLGPRKMILLGLERLSSVPGKYNLSGVYPLFPHVPAGSLARPGGHLDLLIGQDHTDLLPGGGLGADQQGGLRVWSIPFSGGQRVLTGKHPEIKFENPVKGENAEKLNHALFSSPTFCLNTSIDEPGKFLEAEMMGYDVPRKCDTCQKCPTCTIVTDGRTVKEHRELNMLRDSITHDPATNKVTCTYPVVGDIHAFVDNRDQAITRQTATRNSIKKKGILDQYNEQFQDYISRGVLKETSVQEIEDWKEGGGSVHYCAHHGVEKPSSLSTKLRIVVDSAMKNNWKGPSLNQLYSKGPNYINNLYSVLLIWRSQLECGVFDISKAYHSLLTTEREFFMRLVLWKFSDEEDWRTFGHMVVGMGDVPASVLLELAKEIAAKLGHDIDPILAAQFILMSYVDDGAFGGSKEDVMRMRGTLHKGPDGKHYFDGTITKFLAFIGCVPKTICISGETDPVILEKQGKVLGLDWQPTQDLLSFKPVINLSVKRGTARLGPDLSVDKVEEVLSLVLTRRICLQAAQQNFDPLGLISAFTVRFKILMKEIVARDLTWDVPLPEDLQKRWKELIVLTIQLPQLNFRRSLTHEHAVGRPELVVYCDGSTIAFGTVLYIRWKLDSQSEQYFTNLITSKSRVTPKSGMTPPRSELQGLVVGVRCADKVISSLSVRPVRVTIITDSQCSVAACDLNASSLAVFFRNRVLEITSKMSEWGPASTQDAMEELTDADLENLAALETKSKLTHVDFIQHTPGESNPADWPTRGNVEWSQMGPDSVWQQGPAYLRQPRSQWEITKRGSFVSSVPIEERNRRFMEVTGESVSHVGLHHLQSRRGEINLYSKIIQVMKNNNKWLAVRNILARVIRILRANGDRAAGTELITRDDQLHAEWLAQLTAMKQLSDMMDKKGNYESLSVFWQHSVARTRGRLSSEDMKKSTGFESLVVLPPTSRLAYLLTLHAHCDDHRAGGVVQRVRRMGYWIIKGAALAKTVVGRCIVCRHHRAAPLSQKMADLPAIISDVPVRPFTNCALDFTGAVKVRGVVNKRSHLRCYPLIFCCVNTGSVHIALSPDYSTKSFLDQFELFSSLRGVPAYVRTDMGSQLVAAGSHAKEVEEGDQPEFKWKDIRAHLITYGVEFVQCATQAQWRNGRAESAVRALKRTLKHLHQGQDLTYIEFQCLLSRAAAIINRRPLGARHHGGGQGEFCVITPALLLQGGRLCVGAEHGQDLREELHVISSHVNSMEQAFQHWWTLWFDQVWESLVPIKRWRQTSRNVVVGDIVLLRYVSKVAAPTFRYGKVLAVHPDNHGVVRDVTVGTRSRRGRKETPRSYHSRPLDQQRVPVQRLVMLLPLEEQSQLPPADPDLHICEEELRVPRGDNSAPLTTHSDDSEVPHESPAPSAHCPVESNMDDTLPLDYDRAAVNTIHAYSVVCSRVEHHNDFYCWECSFREQFMYEQR